MGCAAAAKTACRPDTTIDSTATPAPDGPAAVVVDVGWGPGRVVVGRFVAVSLPPPHAANRAPALTVPSPIRPSRRSASRREMSPSAQSVAISPAM